MLGEERNQELPSLSPSMGSVIAQILPSSIVSHIKRTVSNFNSFSVPTTISVNISGSEPRKTTHIRAYFKSTLILLLEQRTKAYLQLSVTIIVWKKKNVIYWYLCPPVFQNYLRASGIILDINNLFFKML